MQQNSAPSDENAQNNPQDDPLPPTVDSGEVSGESNTDSKHYHAIKESVNTSMESTRGNGEADTSASATSPDNQRPDVRTDDCAKRSRASPKKYSTLSWRRWLAALASSEVDRRRKVRSHRGVASGNRGMTGDSHRFKSSEDAVSAPGKTQVDESTQDPNTGIPQGDGNRENTDEQTEHQQHARSLAKLILKMHIALMSKDHEYNMYTSKILSMGLRSQPRLLDTPVFLIFQDKRVRALRMETHHGELESAVQTTSRIASSSAISWSSSTTLCSAAPSRSSSKEADDISNYSESDQSSASSAQQQENQPFQQITNDTRTAVAIPPRLTAATKVDKPGTVATRRVDRCSGLLESICRSGDGTVETCLDSSNNPPPSGAGSNIVVGVNTTPATAAATRAAPDATNAKDVTYMTALMRGGGHGPRLDLDSFAPSEPLPAPRTSRSHSAISSPSAPSLGPINATNASQISSFGPLTFVGGCGGGHENLGVSVSSAPCEYPGKSSVVGANDEDGDGSNADVDDICPGAALASPCGSSPGTVAAAIAVEVTSFPSSLLRRVDVVRPAVHADTFAPLPMAVAANRDVDIDMHVPSRTSSLSPGSPLTPAPKSPVQEGENAPAEPAPPAETEKENVGEKADATTPSQPSPPRLSLDQPIRSPKRQAKPWWETGAGSADNEFVAGSEGQAREPGKEEGEGGSDGPAFCGVGTGRGVWDGDAATRSTDVEKVEMEMPERRRKRDGRRERADRCSTGSWISME
ncbi:hypothetical protein BC567DRAFT_273078 [Phyllosticta citribraziliensis]